MVFLVVLIAVLSAVTPEMVSGLGVYGTLVITACTALAGALTAYFVPNGAAK